MALDLDGTLLRSDKQLARYDAVAITEARRRGVKVVIATARPPRSSREIHARLRLDTPMINYNGALIYDPVAGRQVLHKPLAAETARAIIHRARAIEPGIVVGIEVDDKWYTDHDDPNFKTETAKRFKPDFIGSLDIPLQQDITKLMLLYQAERLGPIRHAIAEEFADRAAFHESDATIIQAVHREADKGSALKHVAEQMGVAPERVCAIGDAPNDAGMLRFAGLGLAVANAFGSARDHADKVLADTNDQWAVGRAIEAYVLADDPVARAVAAFRASSDATVDV